MVLLMSPVSQAWEIQAGGDLALFLGGRVKYSLPKNFYVSGGLGFSPAFLIETQSSISSSVGGLNTLDALMFDDMLANSFYFDIRGGWNIDGDQGFFVEAGYAYLGGGGRDSSRDAVENTLDQDQSNTIFNNQSMTAAATLHMLSVHGGYTWPVSGNWVFSASAGLVKPISSSTVFEFSTQSTPRDDIENRVNDNMSSAFSGVFIITGSAWFGYRF